MVAMESEKEFASWVKDMAAAYGWTVWYTQQSGPGRGMGPHSPAGEPDLRLIRPPRVVFAELKREKGKTTSLQNEAQILLDLCPGVEVYLWKPSDRTAIELRLR